MPDFGKEIKPHTLKKWKLLKNYLEKYTLIMSNKFWQRFFYIDAMAGRGKYGQYNGSPLIALTIQFPFTDYIFIENDSSSIIELQENISKLPKRKAIVCRTFPLNSEKSSFNSKIVSSSL